MNDVQFNEFKLSEIFTITRGKRFIEIDRRKGDVPYYSASQFNNGLTDFISDPLFTEQDAIIYTTFGDVYYVNGIFTASDEINILKNEFLNIYNGLYITTILTFNKYKYSFGRKSFLNKLSNDYIKLPATDDGNPNWNFMTDFIKNASKNILYKKRIHLNKKLQTSIEQTHWSDFKIKDLFKIDKGERLVKLERIGGTIPLLTASSVNNGITSYINYDSFINDKKLFTNRITVDMFCNVFYHDYPYFSDDNIHTLSFLNPDFELYYENKYVNLFLVSVLKELQSKFDYGRQVRLKRFEEEIIRLPVKKMEEQIIPDFEFMEAFIKSLPYSKSI